MRTQEAAIDIATYMGMTKEEVIHQALVVFLQERKKSIMRDRLGILARYNVSSVNELEEKIVSGQVPEHPTWEDTIVAENLSARVTEIERYLQRLQRVG